MLRRTVMPRFSWARSRFFALRRTLSVSTIGWTLNSSSGRVASPPLIPAVPSDHDSWPAGPFAAPESEQVHSDSRKSEEVRNLANVMTPAFHTKDKWNKNRN